MIAVLLFAASTSVAASKAFPRLSPGEQGLCGPKPNCVSSLDPRQGRHMEPWRYDKMTRAEAKARLERILHKLPRVTVYFGGEDYVHAEFRSLVFRFVDDVEFYLPMYEPVIHFRSASRVGFSDLGANHKRMTWLTQRFQEER